MSDAEHYFFAECAAHARELPLSKAVTFLRGCVLACKSVEGTEIQKVYQAVSESDKQLELIQSGQLKLNLQPKGHHNGGHQ